MSFQESLNPLPKAFANVSFNNLTCNTLQVNDAVVLDGPFLVNETTSSIIIGNQDAANPLLELINNTSVPDSYSVALFAGTQPGNAQCKIVTLNDVIATGDCGIWSDGTFRITTFQPTSLIEISPNSTNAITCTYVSPGVANTFIENLQLPTTGGLPSSLNYYENYTQNVAFSGTWATAENVVMTISRIGLIVNLQLQAFQFPSIGGTQITTSAGAVPARFAPTSATSFSIPYVNNSSSPPLLSAIFTINTNGSLFVMPSTAFTNVGNAGLPTVCISYVI